MKTFLVLPPSPSPLALPPSPSPLALPSPLVPLPHPLLPSLVLLPSQGPAVSSPSVAWMMLPLPSRYLVPLAIAIMSGPLSLRAPPRGFHHMFESVRAFAHPVKTQVGWTSPSPWLEAP